MTVHDLKPHQNAPTVAAAATLLLYELAGWAHDTIAAADIVPDGVLTAAHAFGVAVIVAAVGWIAQRFTVPVDWIDAEVAIRHAHEDEPDAG